MGFWETQENVRVQCTGKIDKFYREGNTLLFYSEKAVQRVKVLSSNCIRITFSSKKTFLDIPSFAVVNEPIEESFSVQEKDEAIFIRTKEIIASIDKQNGRIIISDSKGNIISEDIDYGFSWTKDTVKCKKKMSSSDHFYGLGEKTGYLDKKGRKYVMWNTDEPTHTPTKDPLYKTIPLLITFNGHYASGIFVDKTCKLWFDLGEENNEYFTFEAEDFEMDYYFIYGPDIKRVISTYCDLTGKMSLPPMWALGYQQCRFSYYPEEMVKSLADSFRQKDIPCDVIYLDIDYMNKYRVFTWNSNRFPDPEKMLKELREKGFKVVTIVDPGVKKDAEYDVYVEGVKKDLFCKQVTGEIYHGKVWPGVAAFPDFSKEETRQWWGEKHQELLGKGVAGIWNDMNEPSDFSIESQDRTLCTVPNDVIMDNDGHPRTFAKYHNSYGFNMCRGTYEGFKKIKPNERPFMVTRSAYAGIQRYSSVWTGDNHSWWEHLAASMPMHMNIGLSGVPFVGGDVGGFQDNATPELFARWMQLGAFTPFFRAHSCIDTKLHEPWEFGEEVEDICRKYIKLRYKLLPYNYNEFYKASQTGLPIMRPLVLEYADDEDVHNLCDQFLYGESIMIAPVYRPSTDKRCVYLPEGGWYDYWTDKVYEGKQYILVDAPLDTLPIFIKGGSIIPMAPEMNYVGEKVVDVLTLEIYPDKETTYSLYEDDGLSNRYKEGEYRITNFELMVNQDGLSFNITPVHKGYDVKREKYVLNFHDINKEPVKIQCTDEFSYHYDVYKRILSITLKDAKTQQVITVNY
jgi:alpha-glucosidase